MNANADDRNQDGSDQAPSSGARILVIDDQSPNIQVVGSVLGKFGHEIIPASDGPTAFKRLAVRLPDLILLDLLMPGMDGCEVCRRIRETPEWRDIPVIFLSAADDKDLIVRAFEAGAVDYLTKPFNQSELVSRVHTQLALKAARDQLKQLAEDKDELLGILAHDLKGHLGGMQMSAQLLRERVTHLKDERSAHLADNMLHSSGQLLAFVKQFLANAAADHGILLRMATVNLSAVAKSAVRQYQEVSQRKQLNLQLNAEEENIPVFADASALAQVLDNLVSNAIKFSPSGRRISVTVRPHTTGGECEIQDEGPGFTGEDKARMFRRYGRLSARPTGGEPSTGLGLSIVRKLILAMKGDISAESGPGGGAVFSIRLPAPPT